MISTYVGRTPPRYYLSNVSFGPQPNYAQLLVKKARSSKETKALRTRLQRLYPYAFLRSTSSK